MARVFGYGRRSTDKQGLTEEAQLSKVRQYSELYLSDTINDGGFEWLYDDAVSAYKVSWFERPQGRVLWALAQPGDHIVVARLDRAFRKVVDGVSVLEALRHKGITFHAVDHKIDMSTSTGRAITNFLLAMAQMEREQLSERTAAALAVKADQNLPINGSAPIGWKKVGQKSRSRFVPCPEDRAQVGEIIDMRAAGASYEDIVIKFLKRRRSNGRRWNMSSVRAAVLAAANGFPKSRKAARRRASA